jgi:hypothetical protein
MGSSIKRSSNCKHYTDSVHTLIESRAHIPGDESCSVDFFTFSCQTSAFEKPDTETQQQVLEEGKRALTKLGCDASKTELTHRINLVGAQAVEYSGEKLSKLGMASNCYALGNDPNDATHRINATCTNQYEFVDMNGNRGRDTNKKFLSNLSACDISDEAMPQLMEDSRKVAAFNASQNGFKADKDTDLACVFSILPQM